MNFQIFFNFFYTFFHCMQSYIYIRVFRFAFIPLFAGGVPVVVCVLFVSLGCPDNHTHAHT